MNPTELIEHYGYLAVLVGTFLEGETILVLGGYMAHRGLLHLEGVMLAALLGSTAGDQLAYFLGRTGGAPFIEKRPRLQARLGRVRVLLERHRVPVMLGFRFLYGLRNATPLVIGVSGVKPGVFLPLNVAGAALWAVLVGLAGYSFGVAIEAFIDDLQRYELWVLGGVAAVALPLLAWHLWRRTRALSKRGPDT
jgi:membrane protein DedA with SNARE-associated domain